MNNTTAEPMIALSCATEIDAPAADVWPMLADYSLDPAWRTGVVSMVPSRDGPPAPGTTTEEVLRVAGRTVRSSGLVTAVEPGRRLAWRTTAGADAWGARRVEPLDDGSCRATLELNVRLHGAERLLTPVFRRVLARNLRRDLRRLGELVTGHVG